MPKQTRKPERIAAPMAPLREEAERRWAASDKKAAGKQAMKRKRPLARRRRAAGSIPRRRLDRP